MASARPLAVVGVFSDTQDAQQAILELQRAGFQDDQIGVAARQRLEPHTTEVREMRNDPRPGETYAAEGAATGLAAGAGLGALAGLALLAGLLPPIGPVIVGGALTVLVTSAAAGAAAMGLAGALAGMGIDKEEADYYQTEFDAGRVVLAITAPGREAEAREIMRRYGAYDMSDSMPLPSEPASAGTLSAAETNTPVAMPMEPGVPANVNLAGEAIGSQTRSVDVPVHAEDLVGDPDAPSTRSTARVPVSEAELKRPSNAPRNS